MHMARTALVKNVLYCVYKNCNKKKLETLKKKLNSKKCTFLPDIAIVMEIDRTYV